MARITFIVVVKHENSGSYEANLSELGELGPRSRDEWREWLDDIGKNNSLQENWDLEVNQTGLNNKSYSNIPTKIFSESTRHCEVSLHVSFCNLSIHYENLLSGTVSWESSNS